MRCLLLQERIENLPKRFVIVYGLGKKCDTVVEVIRNENFDLFGTVETNHRTTKDSCVIRSTPRNFKAIGQARPCTGNSEKKKGGGIIMFYKKNFKCKRIPFKTCGRVGTRRRHWPI